LTLYSDAPAGRGQQGGKKRKKEKTIVKCSLILLLAMLRADDYIINDQREGGADVSVSLDERGRGGGESHRSIASRKGLPLSAGRERKEKKRSSVLCEGNALREREKNKRRISLSSS